MRYEYCLYLITRRPGTLRWRQRLAGVAVKLRTPKYVYSHVWVGGVDAAAERYLRARIVHAGESCDDSERLSSDE